jgi:hypothetical protein
MLDFCSELKALTASFDSEGIPYALCGGLPLAVYGLTQAAVDIDLLIPEEYLGAAGFAARELGYTIEAEPMNLADGAVEIRQISKVDPDTGDFLMLDILLVKPPLAKVWHTRKEMEWEHGSLWVISREGLMALKKLRHSSQDLDDIARLASGSDEA